MTLPRSGVQLVRPSHGTSSPDSLASGLRHHEITDARSGVQLVRPAMLRQPEKVLGITGGGFNAINTISAMGAADWDRDEFVSLDSDPVDVSMTFRRQCVYKGERYAVGDFTLNNLDRVPVIKRVKQGGTWRWVAVTGHGLVDAYTCIVWNGTLYIGGTSGTSPYSGVMAFDGQSWYVPGSANFPLLITYAFCVWDDGSGEKLLAGGFWDGGSIKIFDGMTWTAFGGTGVTLYAATGTVYAIALHDAGDGNGEKPHFSGLFNKANGVACSLNVVRHNGTAFQDLGGGLGVTGTFNIGVRDIASFRGKLYAAVQSGSYTLAVWDHVSWGPAGEVLKKLEPTATGDGLGLTVWIDTDGVEKLVVCGIFQRRETSVSTPDLIPKYGTLTTRTDDDTGILTLTGHSLTIEHVLDLTWEDESQQEGSRTGMAITFVNGDNVTITGGIGDILPAQDSAITILATLVTSTMAPEMGVAFYTPEDGLTPIGGGVGFNPGAQVLQLGSSGCERACVLDFPDSPRLILSFCGPFTVASQAYSPLVCEVTDRGFRGMAGGLRKALAINTPHAVWSVARRRNGDSLIAGNFGQFVNDDPPIGVPLTGVANYVAQWSAKRRILLPMGEGTPDLCRAIIEHQGVAHALVEGPLAGLYAFDETSEVWTRDPNGPTGIGGLYNGLMSDSGDLWALGDYDLAGSPETASRLSGGSWVADSPPDLTSANRAIKADLGDGPAMYIAGLSFPGQSVVFRRAAGGWQPLSGELLDGDALSMCVIHTPTGPLLVICGPLSLGGVSCAVVTFDGSRYEIIALPHPLLATLEGLFTSPHGGGCVFNQGEYRDIDGVVAINFSKWVAEQGWSKHRGVGVNSSSLVMG